MLLLLFLLILLLLPFWPNIKKKFGLSVYLVYLHLVLRLLYALKAKTFKSC